MITILVILYVLPNCNSRFTQFISFCLHHRPTNGTCLTSNKVRYTHPLPLKKNYRNNLHIISLFNNFFYDKVAYGGINFLPVHIKFVWRVHFFYVWTRKLKLHFLMLLFLIKKLALELLNISAVKIGKIGDGAEN